MTTTEPTTDFQRRETQRIAYALRLLKDTPDALLWIDDGNDTWDAPSILGIPVLHTQGHESIHSDFETGCPWVPLTHQDADREKRPLWKFSKFYAEAVSEERAAAAKATA